MVYLPGFLPAIDAVMPRLPDLIVSTTSLSPVMVIFEIIAVAYNLIIVITVRIGKRNITVKVVNFCFS